MSSPKRKIHLAKRDEILNQKADQRTTTTWSDPQEKEEEVCIVSSEASSKWPSFTVHLKGSAQCIMKPEHIGDLGQSDRLLSPQSTYITCFSIPPSLPPSLSLSLYFLLSQPLSPSLSLLIEVNLWHVVDDVWRFSNKQKLTTCFAFVEFRFRFSDDFAPRVSGLNQSSSFENWMHQQRLFRKMFLKYKLEIDLHQIGRLQWILWSLLNNRKKWWWRWRGRGKREKNNRKKKKNEKEIVMNKEPKHILGKCWDLEFFIHSRDVHD